MEIINKPDRETVLQLFQDKSIEVIAGLNRDEVRSEVSLRDLAANSIDRAEIIMLVLEALDIRASLVDFANAKNIGELCDVMISKCS